MESGTLDATDTRPSGSDDIDAKAHIESALKIMAAIVALAYGTGFLVVLTFLNEYGIREAGGEFFKLRYIYVGMLCIACPIAVLCILLGLFAGKHQIPTALPAPTIKHFIARLLTPSENMPPVLLVMLFILSVVFYCILAFAHPGLFQANQALINWLYTPILATLVLRLAFGESKLWSHRLNLIRWILVLGELVPAILILRNIDFASMFRERVHNYLLLQILFFFFVYRFTKWPLLGSGGSDRTSRLLVRLAVLGSLFFLGILSFAHVVYNHIPAEKGGGDFSESPDVQVCFADAQKMSIPVGLLEKRGYQPVCTIPLKIIEETSTDIYVARSSDRGSHSEKEAPNPASLWRSGKYYPVVFEISRSTINSVVILNQGKVELSEPVLPPVVSGPAPDNVQRASPSKPRKP